MDNKKEILKIEIALTEFCSAKLIKFTQKAIKFQAVMLVRKFSTSAILKAISDLFYETRFFPDASIIAEKINKNCKVGTSKALATQEVNRILQVIKSNGFNTAEIKKELGEELYLGIGGCETVRVYSQSNENDIGTLKAQMRDAIEPIVAKKASYEILKKNNAVALDTTKIDFKENCCEQRKIRD